MTRSDVLANLAALGLQPSRRLGQNFLVDVNLLAALVQHALPKAGEHILEIGPGLGILTRELLAAGGLVTAVELDLRLADYLRQHLGTEPNFRLVQGDACQQDYDQLMGDESYRCIANLPYAVSTIVLTRFLEMRRLPETIHVLLQREMAQRLAAQPGTPDYGGLSIQMQWFYQVKVVRRVAPGVFYPPPEVESAFVEMRRLEQPLITDADRSAARHLVRLGFSQRRKQMFKLLTSVHPTSRLEAAYQALAMPADVRAEALSPLQFAQFFNCLRKLQEAP
jgi:16S rRNA (adenine1518-N6/adenine1519-N6)-dimethyltransferase